MDMAFNKVILEIPKVDINTSAASKDVAEVKSHMPDSIVRRVEELAEKEKVKREL